MWWILFITYAFIGYFIQKLSRINKYWSQRGVQQGSPVFLFGDKWGTISRSQCLADMIQKVYNNGPNDRYCGAYDFTSPVLVLKDPDLIKDVLVKDFDHFVDHRRIIPEDTDPIWDKNLFFLTGQKWRDMRTTISPVFTGSKMKQMFVSIDKSAQQFVKYFQKREDSVIKIEIKDTFTRFTNDIIANTVFGYDCNSLEDRENQFYVMAKKITDFSIWQVIKLVIFFIVPVFYKIFKIRILSTNISSFFYNIVKENISMRKSQHLKRPDMVNLLIEARENQKFINGAEITDEDITAQALVFFFAGFDTVSSMMCFMSYELALNPEVQEKLRQEIDETLEACDNELTSELTYEVVKNMKYLDMVVSETLRKWPITTFVTRICTTPYTIAPKLPNENPICLNINDILWLPIYGLHRDPQHFPDPENFDPERFDGKNKIKPYTYMPFGSGPRMCIGYRFALLETKILFLHILSNFEIVPVKETQVPVRICKKGINMTPEGEFWMGLKRRTI